MPILDAARGVSIASIDTVLKLPQERCHFRLGCVGGKEHVELQALELAGNVIRIVGWINERGNMLVV
jgi:hypothetical protein